MAEKAREAFRTISEVANWLDVPAHVLRFWESKFTHIKPVKRAGGRRYYRPADMQLIGGIKTLLHDDGMTIRGVQKMIKEDGVKNVVKLSPPLDMPSDEEGAARRKARRARRQARQKARAETETTQAHQPEEQAQSPVMQDIAAPAEPELALPEPQLAEHAEEYQAEPPQEAPVVETAQVAEATNVAHDDVVDTQDTLLSEPEQTAEPSVPTEPLPWQAEAPQEAPSAEDTSTDPAPAHADDGVVEAPKEEPLILDTPVHKQPVEDVPEAPFQHVEEVAEEPANVVSLIKRHDAPDAEEHHQEQAVAETPEPTPPDLTFDAPTEPDAAPAMAETPQVDIPADPDPSSVDTTDAQKDQVERLKQFRRLNVTTQLAAGSETTLAESVIRLRALRDRVAVSVDGA